MRNKIRLGILFGGRSCEHEVSVISARSMLAALNHDRYEVSMIGIDKRGRWLLAQDARPLFERGVVDSDALPSVLLDYPSSHQLTTLGDAARISLELDVIFPLLHGPYGEDGTVQGLLELADMAYVGSGVAGSAVSMDKEIAKRVFRAEGLCQADYTVLRRHRWHNDPDATLEAVLQVLSLPLFVKPANLGSSVGISKAHDVTELRVAIDLAAEYDSKIIVEAALENCHEVECAVLGNDEPQASVVGEVVPGNEFYDYNDKYIDKRSQLLIPAPISEPAAETVRQMAVQAFVAVGAAGLARADFFVKCDTDMVYINEINTMPGFTPISMYPKLWAASGIEYPALIDRLIELALERQAEKQATRTALD